MKTNGNQKSCSCSSVDSIVIACSGACDLGQVSDLVARNPCFIFYTLWRTEEISSPTI